MGQEPEDLSSSRKHPLNPFNGKIFALTITLILIILIVLVLTLNYFRIIRLENFIPALSFLPHRQEQIVTPNKNNPNLLFNSRSNSNRPTLFPTPYVNQANLTKLNDYLKQNIQSAYLPTAKEGVEYTEHSDGVFLARWVILYSPGHAFSSVVAIKKDIPSNDKTIQVTEDTQFSQPIENQEADQFIQKYFSHPQLSSWTCKTFDTAGGYSNCTSETTVSGEKIKFIVTGFQQIPTRIFIKQCIVPTSSKAASETDYCLPL